MRPIADLPSEPSRPEHDGSTALRRCPPLRIRHLLVWTAVSAIAVSLHRGFVLDLGLHAALTVISFSGATTFLAFATVWAWRGKWHRSPGQGFLVLAGVWLLLRFAAEALSCLDGYRTVVLFGDDSRPIYTLALLWNRFQTVVLAAVAATNILLFADSPRWRITLLLAAIAPVGGVVSILGWDLLQERGVIPPPADTIFTSVGVLRQASYPTAALALLWSVFRDRSLGVSRDWTHWYGIAVWCCFYTPPVLRALRRLAESFYEFWFLG